MVNPSLHPTFRWSRLDDLSSRDVHAILQAREAVFVVEQTCPYQEADEYDADAWHGLCRIDNQLAAYARVLAPGVMYPQPSMGRVMTVRSFRGQGLGGVLVQEAIRFIDTHYPAQGIQIGAQAHLQRFYASFGFQPVGEEYLEDGIPHIDMVRP